MNPPTILAFGEAVAMAFFDRTTYQVWRAIDPDKPTLTVLPVGHLPDVKPAEVVATARYISQDTFGKPSVIVHIASDKPREETPCTKCGKPTTYDANDGAPLHVGAPRWEGDNGYWCTPTVCEFCYRTAPGGKIPDDWQLIMQSFVCPECRKRLQKIPGWGYTVPGGSFAEGRKDPRS